MNRRRRKRFYWLLLLGCLFTVVTVSCASRSATGGKSPYLSPDRVHILRVCTLAQTKCTSFEKSVTDLTRVHQLYQAMQALPKIPANAVIQCPLDDGIKYHLDFFQGGTMLSQTILDASGCRVLHLTTTDARQTNDAFWALLAREIGVSTADLLAVPRQPEGTARLHGYSGHG